MNISLTPELEALVQERVRTGLYHSASEVVRDALRLLQEREELRRVRLEELRKDIAIGIAEEERGEAREFTLDEILARARARAKGTG